MDSRKEDDRLDDPIRSEARSVAHVDDVLALDRLDEAEDGLVGRHQRRAHIPDAYALAPHSGCRATDCDDRSVE